MGKSDFTDFQILKPTMSKWAQYAQLKWKLDIAQSKAHTEIPR